MILDNKEWILSGIGIAVIIFVINIIFRSRDKKQKQKEEQIKGIVQRYFDILDNKIMGYAGIPGLIQSGATQLCKNKDLTKVCEIIAQYGTPYPLPGYIWKYLKKKELLKFVKWYTNKFAHDRHYSNEQEFATLVQKYRKDRLNKSL